MAFKYFDIAANVDIDVNQKNSEQGIHTAAQGGTWQAAIYGFGGLKIRDEVIYLNPWLPKQWKSMAFKINWMKRNISVSIGIDSITILVESEWEHETQIGHKNKIYMARTNKILKIKLEE